MKFFLLSLLASHAMPGEKSKANEVVDRKFQFY
jgi:hypothetical protein